MDHPMKLEDLHKTTTAKNISLSSVTETGKSSDVMKTGGSESSNAMKTSESSDIHDDNEISDSNRNSYPAGDLKITSIDTSEDDATSGSCQLSRQKSPSSQDFEGNRVNN